MFEIQYPEGAVKAVEEWLKVGARIKVMHTPLIAAPLHRAQINLVPVELVGFHRGGILIRCADDTHQYHPWESIGFIEFVDEEKEEEKKQGSILIARPTGLIPDLRQ